MHSRNLTKYGNHIFCTICKTDIMVKHVCFCNQSNHLVIQALSLCIPPHSTFQTHQLQHIHISNNGQYPPTAPYRSKNFDWVMAHMKKCLPLLMNKTCNDIDGIQIMVLIKINASLQLLFSS
jgi:hypothetical protein